METNRKMQRIPHEGAVAGVCAGLGEYFGVDKTWIRVGFILTIIFAGSGIGFVGPLLYIILWIVLPIKPLVWSKDPFDVDYKMRAENVAPAAPEDTYYTVTYDTSEHKARPITKSVGKSNSDRVTAGIILLGIGVFFLLHQFDVFYWRDMVRYWPVLLIFMGLVNVVAAFTDRKPYVEAPFATADQEMVPSVESASETDLDAPIDTEEKPQGEDEPKN